MYTRQADFDLFSKSVHRSREIIQYLKDTLNPEYEISRQLRQMYDFFIYELSRVEAGRKKEVIEEIKPLVRELREAFEEAGKKQHG